METDVSFSKENKWALYIFASLVFISLLTPFWAFRDLLFPYITSKAFFFRIFIELALPLYLYLLAADYRLRPRLKNPLNIAVLFFLAINIISSAFGVNPFRSFWGNFERMGGAFYIAHLVVVYFYVQLLGQAGEEYLKRFIQSFIAVASLVALNGLSSWVGGPSVVLDASAPTRISSTFGNPIFYASYLIIPMFLAAYFAFGEKNKVLKVLYWAAAALQLLGVYSSGTRGAMVGLIVGLFISSILYMVLTKNSFIRRVGLIAIAGCIIVAGGLFAVRNKLPHDSILYRLVKLQDSNSEARLVQWGIALKGFKDHVLLGVGPENYYSISNKYYNPIMYKYDASWFDKPHNFFLEVLVTNGLLGFAAYLFMFGLTVYGLWRAYKMGILLLMEMCLLLAAIITYQVQNLFVFDTVSASIAFYAFLGFAAYLWSEVLPAGEPKKQQEILNKTWPIAVLAVSFLAICFVEYASNITSMEASKRINYGMAYNSQDPQKAADYFNSALAVPFNLDPEQTANYYSDFASGLVSSKADKNFIAQQLDSATGNQRVIAEKIKNDPILWMRLATDQMNQAIVHDQDIKISRAAIDKAVSLAPKRVELLQLYIQYYGYKKDWAAAVPVAEDIVRLNPYSPQLRWQLALLYYLNGNMEQAVAEGGRAVAEGYKFTQLQQFAWYIQYYEGKKDYKKVAPLLEKAIELEPNEIGLYVDLAKVYGFLGDNDHAKALANQVIISDPSQKAAMEAFIKSLK
jgi:O-antigen ligase/Flp pilus assembly protein TadD